jgi:hypothetical protein
VLVELRYETIVVEDGKLHIFRDVYDQETNTEENLRAVLEANGVRFEDLTETERTQVLDALAQMSSKSGAGPSWDRKKPHHLSPRPSLLQLLKENQTQARRRRQLLRTRKKS